MTRETLLSVACGAVLIAAVVPVQAGLILQPSGATASSQFSGTFGDPTNAISQSGLSVGYTSLVTDFDTYVASNPTHIGSTAGFTWFAQSNAPFPITFDFDLGGTFLIESFAMWGDNQSLPTSQNVNAFELLADNNPAFSPATLLGSFNYTTQTLVLDQKFSHLHPHPPHPPHMCEWSSTAIMGAVTADSVRAPSKSLASPNPPR